MAIRYDDSDGSYDHQQGPVVNQSNTVADALTDNGACGDDSSDCPGSTPICMLKAAAVTVRVYRSWSYRPGLSRTSLTIR